MRLEQLQAFLAVADTGSFQKAAHQCGITQSTVSRQIQGLEDNLGAILFHRGSQAKLTVSGEMFLPHAKRICQEWQQASDKLSDLISGKQPELCIAVIHSICAHYLPPVLLKFAAEYPQVQLRITSLGSDRAIKVLRDGLVDLAIVMYGRFLVTTGELVVDPLFDESVSLLTAVDHPLAQHDVVPWSEIVNYPQIIFKDGYGMQRLVRDQFQRMRAELKVALELNTLDAFRGVVRQGQAIALLPQSALVECRQDPMLAIRRTESPTLTRQVVTLTTQDRLQIPPIRRFRELALEMISQPSKPPQPQGSLPPSMEPARPESQSLQSQRDQDPRMERIA